MKRKVLKVTLTIAGKDKSFTAIDGNENQLSSTGLRVSYQGLFGNGARMPMAQIKIYGLALENMLDLLKLRWGTLGALMNRVRIDAGEEGEPLYKVFEGNITFAYPDMQNSPDVVLVIESQAAILENLKPVSPTPFVGEQDVADMIKVLCDEIGYQFENNGVSQVIEACYFTDTQMAKIQKLARDVDIDLYIEQGLVAIAPKGAPRRLKIPIISPDTGLDGYPTPSIQGISFRCLYNPAIRFGGVVSIRDSQISICNGDWRVFGVWVNLEANTPGGKWHCDVNATHLKMGDNNGSE
ncbi:hypothetical protein RMB03_17360 [Acinetobacter sp. V91_7]|uniref:baseplate hub protein n=1 Tax=unclassified Acinetobacter TaxID=196816 RepID=UPI00287DA706|nr:MULTISPECIES: hypothetical protein [unclassified Acinetobacter]MDS7935675.1 hypothetical protein [Acinetobacter sp. V91_4B]MDS7964717.1 hypothetical protein [Acinetobacter sp. V91_7]MDS8025588.1 hypothetical protein [Acinetobacter sp. V91_13]